MGRRRENDSSHEAKLGELGRAFATALLAADEVGAEIAIREALDAKLSSAEIDDENIVPALWYVGQREAGYDVVLLGADVPPSELARAAGRLEADVICLSSTMPGGGDQVLVAIHDVQALRPAAGFVVGGRGIASRVRPQPGIEVCPRVSDVVEAVDAVVKRAGMN
jgi:hypothetical protein